MSTNYEEAGEAALAAHLLVVQSMALQGRMAVSVGMVLHVVAHMTTDPLIVVEAAVAVGTVVTAAQEASLAVIANRCDPEMEVTETAIDTAAEDETTTTAAGKGTTTAMATTTHAANGDTNRMQYNRFVGWVFSISAFLPFFARVRKDTFIFDFKRLHQAPQW